MQIQLKQKDIEAALRMYIAAQGIAVMGKDVTIAFTAKRKQGGITADVTIEDGADIPGFSNAEIAAAPEKPVSVVPRVLRAVPMTADVPAEVALSDGEPETAPMSAEAEPAPAEEPAPPKPKTSSLFGS